MISSFSQIIIDRGREYPELLKFDDEHQGVIIAGHRITYEDRQVYLKVKKRILMP